MTTRRKVLHVGRGGLAAARPRTRKFVASSGDIVHLDFSPSQGHEMKGPHYGLVLTASAFNNTFGFALVAPITQGAQDLARDAGVAISLMGATVEGKVVGVVLLTQIKMLDLESRGATLADRVVEDVMADIKARLHAIVCGDE